MSDTPLIGVLALQGAFREHRQKFESLGAKTREVRLPADLNGLSGLVIPGGESTTIGKLAVEWGLLDPIRALGLAGLPIWGTCAGAIFLASEVVERGNAIEQPLLKLMRTRAIRNAFGRQRESFECELPVSGFGFTTPLHAVFIRAPLVVPIDDAIEVLAAVDEEPVFVRQGRLWGTSFHPELTADPRLHAAFLDLVRSTQGTL